MKLLLDTHVFLWFISGDPRLPTSWQDAIRDPNNEVYLSVVSVWEAVIKHQLGRLPLPESAESYVPKQRQRHMIQSLPLDEPSVCQLRKLPHLHRDPFDRMLICQALSHGMTMASVDDAIRAYAVVPMLE